MARNHSIVINVDLKETRVAIIEDGVIAELHIERSAHRSTVGNVVLGRVTRVLPGMQAAFIEVGQDRAAFLHVEDLIRPDDFDAYLARDPRGAKEGRGTAKSTQDEDLEEVAEAEARSQPGEADVPSLVPPEIDSAPSAPDAASLIPDEELDLTVSSAPSLEDEDEVEFYSPSDDEEESDEEDDSEEDDLSDSEDDEDDLESDDDDEDLEDEDDESDEHDDDSDEDDESDEDEDEDESDEDEDSEEDDSDEDDFGSDDEADEDEPEDDEDVTSVDADESDSEDEESDEDEGSVAAAKAIASSGLDSAVAESDSDAEAAKPEEAAATSLDTEAEAAPRRGRQRRRRRRGRGRNGAEEPEAAAAPKPEAAVSAPSIKPNDAEEGDRGSRRRRRGRRRRGAPEVTATKAVKPEPTVKDKRGAVRRVPARVSRSVPISEVVKEGDQVVVQISKEPIGTKGARVTSHVSLPGRYAVYLPTVEHIGISKRIGHARERSRLRKTIEALKPQTGGLIVRTVAEGLTKKQLKADVGYLIKVWAEVAKRKENAKAPELLYEELDLVLKVARDFFTDEVDHIIIDDRDQYGRLARFIEMFMPGRVKDIKLYSGEEPIFDAYGIEDEIKRALSRKVPLPSGGSLIVDQAEALTAIDVNTGRYVGKGSKDLEETALKTNLEAVDEIAYQLRFRNIGGLVILDLIDMERASNREKVWRALEQRLAKDKAKTTINRISELGLIEMTRKRTRESLGRTMHEPCFYCDGTGHIQSRETIAYEILRQIRRERQTLSGYSVRVQAHPAVVDFLKFESRDALQEAERRYMRRIELVARQEYHIEQYDLQGK